MSIKTLTESMREVLRQFKPGTPIMSHSEEWIGHVVGYASIELNYSEWETRGRYAYQLVVRWMDETEETKVDIADIKLL